MGYRPYHFVPRPILDTEALIFGDEVARRGAFIVALVDFTAPVWKSARCPTVRDVMILLLFE